MTIMPTSTARQRLTTVTPSILLLVGLLGVLLPQAFGRANQVMHLGQEDPEAAHPNHRHRPPFEAGPWRDAHATFYGLPDGSGTFEGACGYDDVRKEGYGIMTAAMSKAIFQDGQICGACFELKCTNDPQWCKPGEPSITITATNLCPPNFAQSNTDGGWCNPPNEHFDLTEIAFLQLSNSFKAGIIPVHYRRVPCKKEGGIRFTLSGNPYFNMVLVWNVGGAGDVDSLQVKGHKNLKWTQMTRNWGQKWTSGAMMVGESLTFRVGTSDGRFSTSWHITPQDWQFGQTFEGKNFK